MGEIYKVTNTLDGKIYIGKTTKTLSARKKDHISKALRGVNNLRFHNAIAYHKPENFSWEVVESCSDDVLNEKEMYYIQFYKSNNKSFGYNMTEGGDNDPKYNLGRKRSLESIRKTAEGLRGQKRSLESRLKMSKAQKNRFKYIKKPTNPNKGKGHSTKVVFQFSLTGILIKEWPSIIQASRHVGVDSSNILRSCTKQTKTSAGFIWRYADDIISENDLLSISNPKKLTDTHRENISKGQRKKVYQYSLDGVLIKLWEGCDLAAKALCICKSGIIRCCNGQQKKSGGFIWSYL